MKNIWLDLELAGDIDDAVTLLISLEKNMNIRAVSLLNPNEIELNFVRYWLNYFNRDIALFVHYDKKIKNRNTTHEILSNYQEDNYPIFDLEEITDNKRYVVFGGGAYTIPNILRKKGFETFVLQGGYAGSTVCEKPVLEKFRNKVECASWNPNVDIDATREMLKYYANIDFISKDICHDSDIDIEFIKNMKSKLTQKFLFEYFEKNKKYKTKMMHDVVALFYIYDSSFCTMIPVQIKETKRKWSSRKSYFSKTKISIDWDKDKFKELFSS